MNNTPKVGVGTIIVKDDKILLGKRKHSNGDGFWGFPGGHLEYGESWEACVRREVMEETNISVKNIRFAAATNDVFEEEGKHYITLFMLSDYHTGELQCMEPDKCEMWDWFGWNELPQPLFPPIQNLLKRDFNPFDIMY